MIALRILVIVAIVSTEKIVSHAFVIPDTQATCAKHKSTSVKVIRVSMEDIAKI